LTRGLSRASLGAFFSIPHFPDDRSNSRQRPLRVACSFTIEFPRGMAVYWQARRPALRPGERHTGNVRSTRICRQAGS
jgi:hypothetical protein